jgi:hypothetical protein
MHRYWVADAATAACGMEMHKVSNSPEKGHDEHWHSVIDRFVAALSTTMAQKE